jgi:hypothetical protein
MPVEGGGLLALAVTLFSLTVQYDWTGLLLTDTYQYHLRDTMMKHDVAAQYDS